MKMKDRLLFETDDSCALCGTRGPKRLTLHHIDGDDSNNAYDNQIVLCHNCHHQYHSEKGVTKDEILDRKRRLIVKTLTPYGLNALKIAKRNDFGVVAMPFLLFHLVDLGYMTQEETQMGYGDQKDATARFDITTEGQALVDQWF